MKNHQEWLRMAPCLHEGPLSHVGMQLLATADTLPRDPFSDSLLVWATYTIFRSMETAFAGEKDPTAPIQKGFEEANHFLAAAAGLSFPRNEFSFVSDAPSPSTATVAAVTGDHYGNLFRGFDSEHYYGEATRLLESRLQRNDIDITGLPAWDVLDAGCGGGRYSVAWARLGARSVTGIDFSRVGIQDALARTAGAYPQVIFQEADVLNIPFTDGRFDCVFSNGVLHHSENWQLGVSELVRVMKKGGLGWIYLIEDPGGYFWDIIEILRALLRSVDKMQARRALGVLGVPGNRIFYMLDHILVPINLRLRAEEIVECLRTSGAKEMRRLVRGCDFDRCEQIHQKVPFATMKYGAGEHRIVFTK